MLAPLVWLIGFQDGWADGLAEMPLAFVAFPLHLPKQLKR